MLERYAMKVARTVLRGGSGSNVTPLPDHADPAPLRSAGQAGWILSARALRWAIPTVVLLGQVWSQWNAPSPDRTAKMAFFEALGFLRFMGESRPSSRRPVPRSGYNANH